MKVLTFQLGSTDFGVRLTDVLLVESNRNIVKTQTGSKFVKGYVFLREKIIPVYDLALRFDYAEQEMWYLVVVNIGETYIGLEACEISHIVDVKENELIPTPAAVSRAKRYFPDVIYLKEQTIFMLNINQLISQEEKQEMDDWIRGLEKNR